MAITLNDIKLAGDIACYIAVHGEDPGRGGYRAVGERRLPLSQAVLEPEIRRLLDYFEAGWGKMERHDERC